MVNTKDFYNGEKVAIIPLFLVNNEIVSDFKAKANHLSNIFFLTMHTFNFGPLSRRDSLTPSMLITALFSIDPKVTRSLVMRLDP